MLNPSLSRIREAAASCNKRFRTTDSIANPGEWRRYEAVLRVIAPIGLSLALLGGASSAKLLPMSGVLPPAAAAKADQEEPVYAAMVGHLKRHTIKKAVSHKAKPKPKPKRKVARKSTRSSRLRLSSRSGSFRTDIDRIISVVAAEQGVDPALVRAVVRAESDYNPGSYSSTGAIGLMQLMPDTARRMGVDDPWDPVQNIRGGTKFLHYLLDKYGSVRLAVAGYNAGPEAVDKYGGVPPYSETQNYVRTVLRYYNGD